MIKRLLFLALIAATPAIAQQAATRDTARVYYEARTYTLSDAALNIVDRMAARAKRNGFKEIYCTGFTDTALPAAESKDLGMRMARAVGLRLVTDGIDVQHINLGSAGKEGLVVETDDGVQEPRNRFVEIKIEP